jgi:hypothetical protein
MGASAASKCAYIEESVPVSSGAPRAQSGISTNAFVLSMNLWEATYTLAPGLPIYCQDCRSIFNSYSKRELKEGTTHTYLWTCEFCGFSNEFDADPESLPTQDNLTYILEAAPDVEETKEPLGTEALSSDDSTVIFCLDISGSMDERAGNVSKLQCVKSAILGQINEMKSNSPNQKLALTIFGEQVEVIKNARKVKTLKNTYEISFPDCLKFAHALEEDYINNTVENSATEISDVVKRISTHGSTALGPGLSVSVGIAERGKPGSKVIICTDGEANIGIGSVDNPEAATAFYEEVGNYARERGIVVNVVAIEGAECKLTCLSSLAEFTEGTLAKVNPHNLGADFAEILADRVVAFQAIATVTLHRALKFKNENVEDLQFNGSRLIRNVGNLPLSSSFSFEYTRKSSEELHESEVDISSLTSIPFQIIIEYKTANGARCLRVISQSLAVTTSQQEAEQQADFEALSANYALRGAKFAQECKFEQWQSEEQDYRQLLARNVKSEKHRQEFNSLNAMADSLNHEIRVQQATEERMGINIQQAPQQSKMARKAVMNDALSSKISMLKKKRF